MSSEVRSNENKVDLCPKHKVPYDVEIDCRVCHGEGMVEDDEGGVTDWVCCWSCRGSGRGIENCEYCLQEDDDVI